MTGTNIIETLPFELATKVFSSVSLRDRINSMDVCRSWQAFFASWAGVLAESASNSLQSVAVEQNDTVVYQKVMFCEEYLNRGGRGLRQCYLDALFSGSSIEGSLLSIVDNNCNCIENLYILNAERVDLAVLDTSLSFLAPTLTQLTLSTARLYWSLNEINSVDSLLRTVLDTCTQLTTLSVSGNVLFSDNYMSASMETTTIKNLSLQAKYIGKLDIVLARCPHLVFLQVVQQDASAAARSVTDIVSEHCPRIQYFHYYTGQGQLIQTQRRCFAGKDKQDISSDMTVGMKELVYFGVEGNISTFLQGPLHNLHTLVITKQMILVSPGVAGLIAKMQNLERLDICGGGNQPLTLEQWINIWKGCTNVKCLTIRCLLTDADLLELPQYCKQLERLDIRYFIHAGISNQAVKGLVERITTLRYVKYWERRSKMPIEGNMIDEILASRGGYLERH